MKNRFKFSVILLLVGLCSCKDYLDMVPDNVATIEYAFRDRVSAEKYLFTCYSFLPAIGSLASDPGIMSGDEWWAQEDPLYYSYTGNFDAYNIKRGQQNINDPLLNYWKGSRQGRGLFVALRNCNVFLENIHNVGGDLSDGDKLRWSAEVKFLKAYYHYYLLRMYGPIPLIKENQPVFAGMNEVKVYREPFDECVNYIVQLLDEAVPDLPLSILDVAAEMGRITQSIALSVKAEVLVMAASPLFNGNEDFADMIDNRNVRLFKAGTPDPEKWRRAAQACKNAIDTCRLSMNIGLYEFPFYSGMLSDSTKLLMTLRHVVSDKWNKEIIWGNTRLTQDYQTVTIPYFTTAMMGSPGTGSFLSPTMRVVEMFYSNNGVPINEDKYYDYENRYKVEKAPESHKYYIQTGFETAKLHINREPRFYAYIGFDGGYWFGNGRFRDVERGTAEEQPWVLRIKRGDASGKYSSMRYSMTGFWVKKSSHFETTISTSGITWARTSFPFMRLADLYLLYAEALNESAGPNDEVYNYIDLVRTRAGLEGVVDSWRKYAKIASKPSTQEGMREIIHRERLIELAFESKRFWDLRRWKEAYDYMNQPIKGWNINGSTTEEFYNVVIVYPLEFTNKEYLWPIAQGELRTNPNLIQNPGW
jgi:hypothetical protein